MRYLIVPAFIALAACEPATPQGASCTEGAYATLVGSPLAAVTLPANLDQRVVRPGEMVTMDYNPDRLTIEVDEAGIITSARCG